MILYRLTSSFRLPIKSYSGLRLLVYTSGGAGGPCSSSTETSASRWPPKVREGDCGSTSGTPLWSFPAECGGAVPSDAPLHWICRYSSEPESQFLVAQRNSKNAYGREPVKKKKAIAIDRWEERGLRWLFQLPRYEIRGPFFSLSLPRSGYPYRQYININIHSEIHYISSI